MIYRDDLNAAGERTIVATHGDRYVLHVVLTAAELPDGFTCDGHTWVSPCKNTHSTALVDAVSVTDNSTSDTLDLLVLIETPPLEKNVVHEWKVTSTDMEYTLRSGTITGRAVAE